jgi:type II pantothenate kinase
MVGKPNTTLPTAVTVDLQELYPYILVNIRSGLSVYRVDDPHEFNVVSSSSIGGATFWGLMRLMTRFTNPTEALQ